jgi:hypothetical protein
MGRRALAPDYFLPPQIEVTKDSDPWVTIKLDVGARRHDGRRVRTIFYLAYNLNLGRWRRDSEFFAARVNQQFVNVESQAIDLIFAFKGE